ncbi:MAG: molybdopterin-binding protein, partial [Polyangiaceae bacterium]
RLSWDEVGPHAILSRATAGILSGTVIFCLPGSVRAVRLGVEKIIIPILAHAMDLTGGRSAHGPQSTK